MWRGIGQFEAGRILQEILRWLGGAGPRIERL